MDKTAWFAMIAIGLTVLNMGIGLFKDRMTNSVSKAVNLSVIAERLEQVSSWQKDKTDKYGDPKVVFDRLEAHVAWMEKYEENLKEVEENVRKLQLFEVLAKHKLKISI